MQHAARFDFYRVCTTGSFRCSPCAPRTSPSAPITFQFDKTLIEDTLGNKLQPNALLVDNLTVDWLRSRLADLEQAINECDDKQTQLLLVASEATDSALSAAGTGLNGSLSNGNGGLSSHRDGIK